MAAGSRGPPRRRRDRVAALALCLVALAGLHASRLLSGLPAFASSPGTASLRHRERASLLPRRVSGASRRKRRAEDARIAFEIQEQMDKDERKAALEENPDFDFGDDDDVEVEEDFGENAATPDQNILDTIVKVERAGDLIPGRRAEGVVIEELVSGDHGYMVDLGLTTVAKLLVPESVGLELGQEIEVVIKEVRLRDGVIDLELPSQAEKEDLSSFEIMSPNEWIVGTVTGFNRNEGVYVQVESRSGGTASAYLPRKQMLLHSELQLPQERLKIDEEVRVRVSLIKEGRMSVSMLTDEEIELRQKRKVPKDASVFADLTKDYWMWAKVVKRSPAGATMKLKHPTLKNVQSWGFVPASEMVDDEELQRRDEGQGNFEINVFREVDMDEVVQVRILGVNLKENLLELTMKEVVASAELDNDDHERRSLADEPQGVDSEE